MIALDLLPEKPIRVFTTDGNVTVTRVGDIMLVPNELNFGSQVFETRPPWSDFIVATDWSYAYGEYTRQKTLGGIKNIIDLTCKEWDIDSIKDVSIGNDFSVALVQHGSDNGFVAAYCTGCNISGVKISGSILNLAVEIEDCEMIRN